MPDETGKLTDAEKAKILAVLAPSTGAGIVPGLPNIVPGLLPAVVGPECPICRGRNWIIADHLVQAPTLGPQNNMQLGGIGYPLAMAISTCGHTIFFNAVVLGIVPGTPPENQS